MENRLYHQRTAPDMNDASVPFRTTLVLTARPDSLIKSLTYTLGDSETEVLFRPTDEARDVGCQGRYPAGDAHPKPLSHTLAPREKEVLFWAAQGKTSWETATLLGLSDKTVKAYLGNAFRRLAVQNKTQAVALCMAQGAFTL